MPSDTRCACVATDARDCIAIRYGRGEHSAHAFECDAERCECPCHDETDEDCDAE